MYEITTLAPGKWHLLAASVRQNRITLYADGRQVAQGASQQQAVAPELHLGPVEQPWGDATHFGGLIAQFTVQQAPLSSDQVADLAKQTPGPLTRYESAATQWPVQTKQMAGQTKAQPPSTLPQSKAPFSKPVAKPLGSRPSLVSDGNDSWTLGDWSLASATDLPQASGATLSQDSTDQGKPWMAATVPGTVLATLIDRGVYPDPAYGLNNMAIPESLSHHDWWYRTQFNAPAQLKSKRTILIFGGINYASQVWVNGERVGQTEGAFVRGRFDITKLLRDGQPNVIAVRVSPPPHPGLPQEESIAAGPGDNGGMGALDGPAFIASEGWDWIPSIRDRDTGLWQTVTLQAVGPASVGDPQVITHLPGLADGGHDLGKALIDIDVPLVNPGTTPVQGELTASFGDVSIRKSISVPPGGTVVKLRPADFSQLKLSDPQLWWPNGYGAPHLYTLKLGFAVNGQTSDQRQLRFGIRQISYELSLFDSKGGLRRVLVSPDETKAPGQKLVDITHQAIHKTRNGWAYSLTAAGEHSSAVDDLKDTRLTPYLVLRVNGVRIAVKGGSWGTDDFRKRISRPRLEPYFRLQRDAHMNVIRNWVGQSTEPVFYDLADEYGMLVFNDFWQSTQNYNIEPQDDALFVRNADDVIRRYRNHPSIALWFGRNEGVPQPLLNTRLDASVASMDGTRLYFPSSNEINLWKSGPYNYREPEHYFEDLAQGFAVELGTPSFPTLEAFKAMMPAADQWPISDDWAYHDWHQQGNGDVASFMQSMATKFGEPTSLADFNRKAQMMNYVTYRAIFEGFNAHLWTRDSGRLLWMSHPAWPSTMWQIYSHDYDTNAAYYGAQHASEPVHVQMNLPDRSIAVVNTATKALSDLTVSLQAFGVNGESLGKTSLKTDAPAGETTAVKSTLDLSKLVASHGLIFVSMTLHDVGNHELSRNFYWTAKQPADMRQLVQLPTVSLDASVADGANGKLIVQLHNPSRQVALNTKLTLVDAQGQRILPAYYSDNYISLAPAQSQQVTIEVSRHAPDVNGANGPASGSLDVAQIELRGWNIAAQTLPVTSGSQSNHATPAADGEERAGKLNEQTTTR
ncbi:MAG: sugar-binding domain-containing protein [Rhodanobacter sp.]